MANQDRPFDLGDAYSLATPDDNRALYAKWAETYDDGFRASHGYIYHEGVVQLFARFGSAGGPILDVGCGTGAVGISLAEIGLGADIHGIDISPEMLAVAATKTQADGRPVYARLHEADLTQTIDLESNFYSGGVISAGTFTHGHLGPESLDELLRVGAPGSMAAIGINSAHYISHGFAEYFDDKHRSEAISKVEIVELAMYDASSATIEDKSELDSVAYVAVFINRTQ